MFLWGHHRHSCHHWHHHHRHFSHHHHQHYLDVGHTDVLMRPITIILVTFPLIFIIARLGYFSSGNDNSKIDEGSSPNNPTMSMISSLVSRLLKKALPDFLLWLWEWKWFCILHFASQVTQVIPRSPRTQNLLRLIVQKNLPTFGTRFDFITIIIIVITTTAISIVIISGKRMFLLSGAFHVLCPGCLWMADVSPAE